MSSRPIVSGLKPDGGAAGRRPSVPGALYPDKFMRSGAVRTARLAHNQKVDGSNPSSRTQLAVRYRKGFESVPAQAGIYE